MKVISAHSHLLSAPCDIEKLTEHFDSIWVLELPTSIKISYKNSIMHPADSAEMLQTAKLFPDFILPFKWVDFRLGADQIDRAVDDGFVGFKGICPQLPYDDDSYMPIYEKINEYGSCMVFHTGHVSTPPYRDRSPEFGYNAMNMTPSTLYKIARFFPDMTVVAAHCGAPFQHELISNALLNTPNYYMDFSGGCFELVLREFIEKHAMLPAVRRDGKRGIFADKLLYGADAYLGDLQLHNDIINDCQHCLDWCKNCIERKLPWANQIHSLFHGNAALLNSMNKLIKS